MDWVIFLAAAISILPAVLAQTKYYGLHAGDFKTQAHGVEGSVYLVDDQTLFISNFHYDGQGPDAFFWGDAKEAPTPNGFIISIFNGTDGVLGVYSGQNLILKLPAGKSLKDVRSLAVWCRRFTVNFGSVVIPNDYIPSEKSLGPLPSLAHGVRSDDVIIKDSKTILIKNLFYDGAGPDAFFLAGTGPKPHSKGIKIPDENGRLEKLHGYVGNDVLLRLPGDLTVFDIEWMGLYCIRFEQNFGHVMIPERPNVPPDMEDLLLYASSNIQRRQYPSNVTMSQYVKDHQYYGKPISEFKTDMPGILSGIVFAATDDTLFLMDFWYDVKGPEGPGAHFWAGTTEKPSSDGFIVPNEMGSKELLGAYHTQNIAITLPDGKKISDIKWFSVWCQKCEPQRSYGHILIPDDFQVPTEKNIGPLSSLAHGVHSGNVIVKNSKTIHISDLHYDGAGPDAFFLVGKGEQPHPEGIKVPDENGSLQKLHAYQGEDVELRLPDGITVFDIDWLALYCIKFEQNFGHVMLKLDPDVPADLKALRAMNEINFENCEELFPGIMQVKWSVMKDDLYLQLAGKVETNEYLSFGRSGSDDRASMVGADVAVAFYDTDTKMAKVVDYYLSAKSQCSSGSGACPDQKLQGKDNTELISWERSDGIFRVTFKRPLAASDDQDLSIPVAIPIIVVAAIGSINSEKEVAFHTHYYNKDDKMIKFGRKPAQDRCSPFQPSTKAAKPKAWIQQKIAGTTKFVAQIGPAGGDKGYTAITGIQSWGIAWWINGLLIPEITVHRGTNYTFIVEGGNNPSNSASYHPLYITNNPEGGGSHHLDHLGLPDHKVYAGINMDSSQNIIPTGTGRYCEWKHISVDKSEESATFEDYKRTLKLECEEGKPGQFTWMPDEDTPDLVYYQCFTHRNLGWRIHVLDPVDSDKTVAGAMGRRLEEEIPSSSTHAFASFFLIVSVAVTFFLT